MRRNKGTDPKTAPLARKKKRAHSRPHPDDPVNLRICGRQHVWDKRTAKQCMKCQYIDIRNRESAVKKEVVEKWGMPDRPDLITKKRWVHNARKLFQCFLDCWARDEHNGWYLRKEMLPQLQEIREQAGVMLWTKIRNSFSPRSEMTEDMEKWLSEQPIRRYTDS